MSPFLFDTNIVIDYSCDNPKAVEFVETQTVLPSVSVITVAEIIQGVRDKERPFFQRVFEVWNVLPITHEIALLAGEYRLAFFKSHNLGMADAFIAASAKFHKQQLATLNVKDFPMSKGLKRPY